jgi:peptidoglycan lytic transglycosylase
MMRIQSFKAGGVLHRSIVAAMVLSLPLWPAIVRGDALVAPPSKVGRASWYGAEFARRRTASGTPFDPASFTGAHRTLPLGSKVRITNLRNGRSVLVTINDRGPFRHRREIDVSFGAARALGMLGRGVERVLIEPLGS